MDAVEEVVGEDFGDARLPGQDWRRRHYTKCHFRDADLSGLRTESVIFTDCDFTGADLSESQHVGTAFGPVRSRGQRCGTARSVNAASSVPSSTAAGCAR